MKIYDIDTWHDGRNVLYSWGLVKMLFRSFSYEKINLIRRRQLGTTGRILVTSLENWKVHREESSDSQKCNRTHILGLLPFEPTQNFRIRPCIADLRRKCVRARTFFDVFSTSQFLSRLLREVPRWRHHALAIAFSQAHVRMTRRELPGRRYLQARFRAQPTHAIPKPDPSRYSSRIFGSTDMKYYLVN